MAVVAFLVAFLAADAKAEEVAKARAASLDAAAKKYYTEFGKWPEKAAALAPYLEAGPTGLLDPWENAFRFEVVKEKTAGGKFIERPFVWTERKVGKEVRVYGRRPPRS